MTDPRYQGVERSPVVRLRLSPEQFGLSPRHHQHPPRLSLLVTLSRAVCHSPTLPAVSPGRQAQAWQVWEALGLYAQKGLNLELQAKEPRPCLEPMSLTARWGAGQPGHPPREGQSHP